MTILVFPTANFIFSSAEQLCCICCLTQVVELTRVVSEATEMLVSKVKQQPWFAGKESCSAAETYAAWVAMLDPSTKTTVLIDVLQFTETTMEWVAQPFLTHMKDESLCRNQC